MKITLLLAAVLFFPNLTEASKAKKMQYNCKPLFSFFQFIGSNPSFSLLDYKKEAESSFQRVAIKGAEDYLVVEFNQPVACYGELTKTWGPPFDFDMISPPPISPGDAPLKLDPNDNAFMWVTQKYKRQGWIVSLSVNENRIKSFNIRK